MDKFNLTEKPWIPCLMIKTNKIELLCLFHTLTRAREIKEIVDNSPLIVVSLHRLLLAILHRNFKTERYEDWKDLWRKGFWDAEKLRAYFDKDCKDRFNLFDDERPFYQYSTVKKSASGEEATINPLATLMQEKASGNNATLFDHNFEANQQTYPPEIAACYLIARQAFSFSGTGCTYPFGFFNSPLINGFSILAVGNNLFETLALNLVKYPHKDTFPVERDDDGKNLDKPFWERDELIQATEKDSKGTNLLGYLDYLTWQSRRIKLIRDDNSEQVKSCQLQQNFKLKESELFFDPFKVYGKREDRKDKKAYYTLGLKEDKGLWRESHAIFQQAKTDDRRNLFDHLAEIEGFIREGEIEGEKKYSISIFGIINNKASVLQWAHERLPLPLAYLKDNELLNKLEKSIDCAVKFGGILQDSIKKLRKNLNEQAWESSIRSVSPMDKYKQEGKLINLLPAMSVYWSSLEVRFKKLLTDLPEKQDEAMQEWYRVVDKTATKAFNQSVNSLGNSAKELKAIAKADKEFHDRSKNLKKEYGLQK